jgi:hypothetical protein
MNPPVVVPFTTSYVPKSVPPKAHPHVVSARSVRRQLSNIVKSDGFVRAERMRCFLQFVVEETLAGHANQLCEYSIGISVFARDPSFQPGLDPIVRNDARRLRHKLLEYYQRCDHEDQVVIEVPKGGYVPAFRYRLRPGAASMRQRYRLAVSLTRADGTEVWTTQEHFQLAGNANELCFALRLEVSDQEPAVSALPISQCPVERTDGINHADRRPRYGTGWNRIRRSGRSR